MASSAKVVTHSLYSIIFSKQESMFSCQLIIAADTQAAEPQTHRRRRSVPTALIRFISKRWHLLKYLLAVHESSHMWRTHTYTHTQGCGHTGLIGSQWPPSVKSASEHPGSQLAHRQRLLTSRWAVKRMIPLSREQKRCRKKNDLTHTKAQNYSNNSDRNQRVAVKTENCIVPR